MTNHFHLPSTTTTSSRVAVHGIARLRAVRDTLFADALRADADRVSALEELNALDAALGLRGAARPATPSLTAYRDGLVVAARAYSATCAALLARAAAAEALLDAAATATTSAFLAHKGSFNV